MTLTGPPGVGKSRLAVEAARSLEHEFPDGIWLVDFARAGDAEDAVRLLAHAVDVRGSDPLARVASRLGDAGALVVLDACEHVLDEAARIASTLARGVSPGADPGDEPRGASRRRRSVRAPRRAPLGSAAVGALPRARAGGTAGLRARTPRPSRSRREIARRVDGLPLAIELAAARVNVLGLAELVSILERRAALLRDSPASDPEPHRAARARGMELRPLARGREDAAPAARRPPRRRVPRRRSPRSQRRTASTRRPSRTSSPRWSTSRSCRPSFSGGVARYDMLDTVREYVLERLAESGGLAAARAAHAEYFAALADEARVELRGPEWLRWQTPARAGERQSLGCARVRAGRAATLRVAIRLGTLGVVLRAGRARLRGTALPRARAVCHARRRTGRATDRAARRPLLPRDRGARSRRRARGGRTRARARRDRCGTAAAGASRS